MSLWGTSYYCGCWWGGDPAAHTLVCYSHSAPWKARYHLGGSIEPNSEVLPHTYKAGGVMQAEEQRLWEGQEEEEEEVAPNEWGDEDEERAIEEELGDEEEVQRDLRQGDLAQTPPDVRESER